METITTRSADSYKQASSEGREVGGEEIAVGGRGAGTRRIPDMTILNKIVIVQQQQDYPERTYTDLKSAINGRAIPNEQ